jgi:hypothetical protein
MLKSSYAHRKGDARRRTYAPFARTAQGRWTKIERDPKLLQIARNNIKRCGAKWRSDAPAWLQEWRKILNRPWRNVAALTLTARERETDLSSELRKLVRTRIQRDFKAVAK